MSMGYREQIFVLTAAFTNAVKVERDDDHCNVTMKMDGATVEALEKLKKDTKAGVTSIHAEGDVIEARFDLGFLDLNEPYLSGMLREKSAPPKVSAAERRARGKFIPYIVK